MNDVINGEIVAGLEEWQGASLILASLAVAYLLRCWHRARDSSAQRDVLVQAEATAVPLVCRGWA
jgi:hypothetical protein